MEKLSNTPQGAVACFRPISVHVFQLAIFASGAITDGGQRTLELIQFSPHSMTVINLLDTEDYLRGVVPSEMPASWNLEALKAQAVAARSYASAHMEAGSKWWKSEGYDLVPDVETRHIKAWRLKQNDGHGSFSNLRIDFQDSDA